jgi:hypothetical protein
MSVWALSAVSIVNTAVNTAASVYGVKQNDNSLVQGKESLAQEQDLHRKAMSKEKKAWPKKKTCILKPCG